MSALGSEVLNFLLFWFHRADWQQDVFLPALVKLISQLCFWFSQRPVMSSLFLYHKNMISHYVEGLHDTFSTQFGISGVPKTWIMLDKLHGDILKTYKGNERQRRRREAAVTDLVEVFSGIPRLPQLHCSQPLEVADASINPSDENATSMEKPEGCGVTRYASFSGAFQIKLQHCCDKYL